MPPRRVIAIAAAGTVLLTRVDAPKRNRSKYLSALPNVIEETVCREAENIHVAPGPWPQAGLLPVAVVDKGWMTAALSKLTGSGAKPTSMIIETLMAPVMDGNWSVVIGADQCFVRTSGFDGMALDIPEENSPPQALAMLMEQARADGLEPDTITVYHDNSWPGLRLDDWMNTLGVGIESAGVWDWAGAAPEMEEETIELLQGAFAPVGAGDWSRWLIPAAAAIVAIILNIGAITMDLNHKIKEEAALRQRIEESFRQTLGDVVMADAQWQLKQYLQTMRWRAGMGGDPGLDGLLALAADPLAQSAKLKSLEYSAGELRLTLVMLEKRKPEALIGELDKAGLATRQETAGLGRHGMETTLLITQRR